jgi:prephenate dehydrogenase
MLRNVAIIGVGLIGGSFALALKRHSPATRIVGCDHDEENLNLAIRSGVVDSGATVEQIAADQTLQLIVLAVPVRAIPAVLVALAPGLPPQTVITDVGSTKGDVIAAARLALGDKFGQFVPAHPIAGREHAGVGSADITLFDGKKVVLVPCTETIPAAQALVNAAWVDCGATVTTMSAADHDRVFAAVSHLPHLLAFTLVDELASRPDAKVFFEHAASGFRDFTRIASSSSEMWRDIALNNQVAVLQEIDRYREHLEALRDALSRRDSAAIEALMRRAQEARNHWLAGQFEHFRDESV